jgi:hypothetical protein
MAELVAEGAMMTCTFGVTPAPLSPLPNTVMAGGLPSATIMDFAPMVNIPTFGMCSSPANPEVITATAAALGVLTPMPCIPATVAPWVPGAPTVLILEQPALTADSMCMCTWGGEISITEPGQVIVQVAG